MCSNKPKHCAASRAAATGGESFQPQGPTSPQPAHRLPLLAWCPTISSLNCPAMRQVLILAGQLSCDQQGAAVRVAGVVAQNVRVSTPLHYPHCPAPAAP